MLEKKVCIRGIGRLAKELGVNRSTLSLVAHGRRSSARLEAILREHGVKVEKRK